MGFLFLVNYVFLRTFTVKKYSPTFVVMEAYFAQGLGLAVTKSILREVETETSFSSQPV